MGLVVLRSGKNIVNGTGNLSRHAVTACRNAPPQLSTPGSIPNTKLYPSLRIAKSRGERRERRVIFSRIKWRGECWMMDPRPIHSTSWGLRWTGFQQLFPTILAMLNACSMKGNFGMKNSPKLTIFWLESKPCWKSHSSERQCFPVTLQRGQALDHGLYHEYTSDIKVFTLKSN